MKVKATALILPLALGLLAAPLPAEAQKPGKVYRIGYFGGGASGLVVNPFRERLRELGWIEGQNLAIEYRRWGKHPERINELAADLVRSKVDVILALGPDAIAAAKKATDTIPIVMLHSVAPVRFGFAASLAHPGGNVTGLTWDTGVDDMSGKVLQVFTETLPNARTFAVLWNLNNRSHPVYLEAQQALAPRFGVRIVSVGIGPQADLESAFRRMKEEGAEALIVYPDRFTIRLRDPIMAFAIAHKLPTLVAAEFGFKHVLIVFGPHVADMPARAAVFIDKILRGANPSELPIEQPAKYDLTINLRVARALGLTIPPSVLFRADRVIR